MPRCGLYGNLVPGSGGGGGSGEGMTPEQVQQLNKATEDIAELQKTKANVKTKVLHGTNDTTFELPENITHVWDEVPALTITLKEPENPDIENEYRFVFTSGATPTELSLPKNVKTDIYVEPNTTYECSIVDDRMKFGEWSVADA